jgi:hypothetical protein
MNIDTLGPTRMAIYPKNMFKSDVLKQVVSKAISYK